MKPPEEGYAASFKAAVALQAAQPGRDLSEVAERFGVTVEQVARWRAHLLTNAYLAFEQAPSADERFELSTTQSLQKSANDLAHTIAENSTLGFAMMNERGYCVYANRTWLRMTGFSNEEIRSKPLHDLVHHHYPDGRTFPLHECPIDRALPENFNVRAHEDLFFRKDGSSFDVVCAASPIFREGRAVATVIEIRDTSEHKKRDRALQEAINTAQDAEARFRTITEVMPQIVWSSQPDGYHDYYNQRWYEFTGVPANSTDGDGGKGLFHRDDQASAWATWRHSLATGEPYNIEYRLRHYSGEYRWVLGRALPVRDAAGKIIRWMGTCTDIHEQRTARDQLQASSTRKDEFLAMLAHELRNPLAPLSAAAHILKLKPDDATRVRHSADVIARQTKHMTALVDELLDVSRLTRGLVQLKVEPCDLRDVVHSALEQVRPLLESRTHEIVARLAHERAIVQGDRVRLVQVVANLLNNAVKYTPKNGVIAVSVSLVDGEAQITVADNGPGIEQELLPHIFDLFTQGKRTLERSHGGLGVGLALVKSLVALHRGSVTVESCYPEGGSTFKVTLPLAQAVQHELDLPPSGSTPAKRLRVMVVDDNEDAGMAISEILAIAGHKTAMFTHPSQALEAVEQECWDVYVLDTGLPDIDGYELAQRLRRSTAGTAATLIALTGYGQEQDILHARGAGFDHHFVKPVDPDRLLAVVQGITGAG